MGIAELRKRCYCSKKLAHFHRKAENDCRIIRARITICDEPLSPHSNSSAAGSPDNFKGRSRLLSEYG